MRLYKRKKVWYVDYSLNGKRVRRRIGTSKKQASLVLKTTEADIIRHKHMGIRKREPRLFSKLCAEYLDYSKANKTKKSYERDIISTKHLLIPFRNTMISEISAQDIERYKNARCQEVQPATVNRELSCIKHMLTKAEQWNYIDDNPLRSVKKLREPAGRIRYLNDDEVGKLLYCAADHLRPIIVIALHTGMRKGEILGLRWQDIDLVNRMIVVRDSKNNESRHIPINDVLYAELIKLRSNSDGNKPLFATDDGKPRKNIDHAFEGARKRAKISDFRFHDLRHTFASHLVMKGVDIRTVQRLMGHKTIAMTMRYSHLSDKTLKDAVDRLSQTGYNGQETGTNMAQVLAEQVENSADH